MPVKKSKEFGERMVAVVKRAVTSETKGSLPSADLDQKVVIRYTDGRVLRGFVRKRKDTALEDTLPDSLLVKESDGKRVNVVASDLKAIFFVKSFEGDQDYTEFKVFSSRPSGKGVWVRVRFKDGEVIEGVAPNCIETYSRVLFYITPPDPKSNNQGVLVSKHYLKEMQVLGLASE
jgi:uncharacterized protein DUF6982